MDPSQKTSSLLQAELARAEFVVAAGSGDTKLHEPTIENHRGQIIALRKAISFLQEEEPADTYWHINVSWRTIGLLALLGYYLVA